MIEPDIFPENVTPDNVHEMRLGQIGTMKGKLENVRYSTHHQGPSLVITFADWNMLAAGISDYHTARSIPHRLGAYVAVKVQCITEDCDLRALAIWELGSNPVPIALGEPFLERNALGVWVR